MCICEACEAWHPFHCAWFAYTRAVFPKKQSMSGWWMASLQDRAAFMLCDVGATLINHKNSRRRVFSNVAALGSMWCFGCFSWLCMLIIAINPMLNPHLRHINQRGCTRSALACFSIWGLFLHMTMQEKTSQYDNINILWTDFFLSGAKIKHKQTNTKPTMGFSMLHPS